MQLKLDDRTYEDNDGTWTTIEWMYCDPWANGDRPYVYVKVCQFYARDDNSFDWKHPVKQMQFHLGDQEVTMLRAFLGAAKDLMPKQWTEFQRERSPSE